MAEVMNAMGYSAAAVGNHEFDFGLDVLKERADASTFPFVSANIRNADGSTPTEWGIERFVIVEVNEVRVGITGLTTLSTPVTTKPQNVSEFDFLSYETALREVVPEMRSAGAELILVPGHICQDEVTRLAGAGLDIDLVGGGHCNELFSSERNGVISLIGGFHLGAFAVAEIEFDTGSDEVVSALVDTVQNNGGSPDREVQRVVSKWQGVVEDELNTVIGYLDAPIERRSAEMQNLTTYAWLEGYPSADFAVTNLGGMRARFPSGEISLADLIGVMPFDNVIVSVELTGDEFLRTFGNREAAIGGIQQAGSRWIVDATGEEIDRNEMYTVLVNDFMWGGGDGYDLQRFDPDGYNTAIDWRQPVIDWMIAQESSRRDSMDEAVNALGR